MANCFIRVRGPAPGAAKFVGWRLARRTSRKTNGRPREFSKEKPIFSWKKGLSTRARSARAELEKSVERGKYLYRGNTVYTVIHRRW